MYYQKIEINILYEISMSLKCVCKGGYIYIYIYIYIYRERERERERERSQQVTKRQDIISKRTQVDQSRVVISQFIKSNKKCSFKTIKNIV